MNRRTFVALALAGTVCGEVRKVSASTEAAETAGTFPISRDDYRKVEAEYLPQLVDYSTPELPGTIIVDPEHRFLYLVLGSGRAKRYGIGVGREGFGWSGTATIKRKAEWPRWVPPKEMIARDPKAARWPDGMPGGPDNPLGARALYLYQGEVDTLFRIHGTPEAGSIGRAVSSGCIRMLNADVAELFDRVEIGTKVIVLGSSRPIALAAQGEEEPARTGPAPPSPEQQEAVRAAFERRRELRRRKRTIADWLRSLEEDD